MSYKIGDIIQIKKDLKDCSSIYNKIEEVLYKNEILFIVSVRFQKIKYFVCATEMYDYDSFYKTYPSSKRKTKYSTFLVDSEDFKLIDKKQYEIEKHIAKTLLKETTLSKYLNL